VNPTPDPGPGATALEQDAVHRDPTPTSSSSVAPLLPGEPIPDRAVSPASTEPASTVEEDRTPVRAAAPAPPAPADGTATPLPEDDTPYRGVATGFCASIAKRIGVSPMLIRAAWGVGIIIGLVLGVIPGLLVLGAYLVLSQVITIDSDCVPDKGHGWPSATDAQKPSEPDHRLWLKEFVQFLWSTDKAPKPRYVSASHGFVTSGLRCPDGSHSDRPGKYAQRMPFGRMLVYDGWLVFLTESRLRPGEIPPWSKMWIVILEQLREYRKWLSVIRISMTAYSAMTTEQRDRMRKTLGNPNSFFVPLSTVTGIRFERYMAGPRIRVVTTDRELMFAPHGMCEWHWASIRRYQKSFLGPWQPELNRILIDAITANRQRIEASSSRRLPEEV
jgi:phage shock protein PspC (stress-responsive transcriptional regulator)